MERFSGNYYTAAIISPLFLLMKTKVCTVIYVFKYIYLSHIEPYFLKNTPYNTYTPPQNENFVINPLGSKGVLGPRRSFDMP